MTNQFNFDDAVKALQAGKNLNGKDGVLTGLIKQLTESALQAELEQHLTNEQQPNRKNGSSTKTVKSSVGNFELDTPRDRSGSLEPQLVKKNQTALTDEIDQKILSMFSMGMSYRDINKHIEDMYGMNVATGMISAVTDKLIPELKAWQQRPLDSHYPIVWLDAIHYKVKEDGRYINKAVYTLLGLIIHGKKEILVPHIDIVSMVRTTPVDIGVCSQICIYIVCFRVPLVNPIIHSLNPCLELLLIIIPVL